jgi:hypothetical protein
MDKFITVSSKYELEKLKSSKIITHLIFVDNFNEKIYENDLPNTLTHLKTC